MINFKLQVCLDGVIKNNRELDKNNSMKIKLITSNGFPLFLFI